MTLFLAFWASFIFIGLRSFQQRNVAFDHYWSIVPTSLAMSFVEVFVVAQIVQRGYDLALVVTLGLGAGFGSLFATILHKRLHRK